jgi:hypothetical protein
MKLKSDMSRIVKRWYSDIADLGQKHQLVVVMRDNAGENKSQEIIELFESVGVKNYFSTAHEQWHNGLAEAAINSIMMISRTVMVESGLGGRFWFKSALAAIDARNATYKERIGTTPWRRMHGERRGPQGGGDGGGRGSKRAGAAPDPPAAAARGQRAGGGRSTAFRALAWRQMRQRK